MKTYLISELAEEFDTSKTQIRRLIKENNIVAINETTREHKYVAKEYSELSREIIKAEQQPEQYKNNIEKESEQVSIISQEIIEILKQDKNRLIRELDELKQDKREQEERFHDEKQSFHNLIREEKNRSELLQIELMEKSVTIDKKSEADNNLNTKWYNFLKRKK